MLKEKIMLEKMKEYVRRMENAKGKEDGLEIIIEICREDKDLMQFICDNDKRLGLICSFINLVDDKSMSIKDMAIYIANKLPEPTIKMSQDNRKETIKNILNEDLEDIKTAYLIKELYEFRREDDDHIQIDSIIDCVLNKDKESRMKKIFLKVYDKINVENIIKETTEESLREHILIQLKNTNNEDKIIEKMLQFIDEFPTYTKEVALKYGYEDIYNKCIQYNEEKSKCSMTKKKLTFDVEDLNGNHTNQQVIIMVQGDIDNEDMLAILSDAKEHYQAKSVKLIKEEII